MVSISRRQFAQLGALSALGTLLPQWARGERSGNAACHKVIDAYIQDHRFQGVVLLGRQGRSVFSREVGLASFEAKKPIALDTRFGVASISKMFTSVTVLRLVEQQRLSLDTPIGSYLPWYRKDLGARLTLRRLLANNSGVLNQFSPVWKADPAVMQRPMTTVDAVHRYCEADLIFNPGERFDYSLSNWILVLAIVESVTHKEFATAMQEITLRPLGLMHTSTEFDDNTAIPYSDTTPPEKKSYARPSFVAAAGGYYSNAGDLLRAGQKVFDGHFLMPESLRSLTTREVDTYALGGSVRDTHVGTNTVQAAWDTGNSSGYRLGTWTLPGRSWICRHPE
jgi:CubicO group peptidase (beta-lactamase class C family)